MTKEKPIEQKLQIRNTTNDFLLFNSDFDKFLKETDEAMA